MIREIISQNIVGSQEELRSLLQGRGIEVTQATLSRDMHELGVTRVLGNDGPRYMLETRGSENRLAALFALEIEAMESNESLIVIRTLPGRAQGVAEVLDRFRHPEILGTIAGDNTIFIAPRSVAKIDELLKDLRSMVMKEGGG